MNLYDPKTGQTRTLLTNQAGEYEFMLDMANLAGGSWLGNLWYRLGQSLRPIIDEYIDGRYTMSGMDCGALMRAVAMSDGDYIEIGALQGGSACAAGIAQMITGGGGVFCVDPFGWASGQTKKGPEPSVETVLVNAGKFGLQNVFPFEQRHPPLPRFLESNRFGVGFIDGDHSYEAAKADWLNLAPRVDKYVLLHDWNLKKHGVGQLLDEIEANDPDWECVYKRDKMAVLERVIHGNS